MGGLPMRWPEWRFAGKASRGRLSGFRQYAKLLQCVESALSGGMTQLFFCRFVQKDRFCLLELDDRISIRRF